MRIAYTEQQRQRSSLYKDGYPANILQRNEVSTVLWPMALVLIGPEARRPLLALRYPSTSP